MELWIARDQDNTLIVFQSKPVFDKNKGLWDEILNEDCMVISPFLFPKVTFENSPQKVKLELIKD